MKNNTYDIPAYKYGLAIPNEEIEYKNENVYQREYKARVYGNKAFIVPFEHFDGLTVEQTLNLTRRKGIYFICYSEYDNSSTGQKDVFLHWEFLFLPSYAEKFKYRRLDKIIEFELSKVICNETSSVISRRVARCFLERYMYDSYEEVEAKLLEFKPVDEKNS